MAELTLAWVGLFVWEFPQDKVSQVKHPFCNHLCSDIEIKLIKWYVLVNELESGVVNINYTGLEMQKF